MYSPVITCITNRMLAQAAKYTENVNVSACHTLQIVKYEYCVVTFVAAGLMAQVRENLSALCQFSHDIGLNLAINDILKNNHVDCFLYVHLLPQKPLRRLYT